MRGIIFLLFALCVNQNHLVSRTYNKRRISRMRSSHQDIILYGQFFLKLLGKLVTWPSSSNLVFYCYFLDQLFCRAPTSFIKFPLWQQRRSKEFQLRYLGFLSNNGSFGGNWLAMSNISYIGTSSHQWLSHPHYYHSLFILVLFLHSLHSSYFVTRKYGVVPYWTHSSSDEEFEKILLSDRSSHQRCSRKILQIL